MYLTTTPLPELIYAVGSYHFFLIHPLY